MLAGLLATMRVSGGLQSCSLLEPDELVCMWWAKDWRLSSRYIWPAENENRCFPFTARFCPVAVLPAIQPASRDFSALMASSTDEKPAETSDTSQDLQARIAAKLGESQGETRRLILFDGQCRLCLGFVAVVVSRDSGDRFRFAPLQSKLGQEILVWKEQPKDLDSVVLLRNWEAFTHSDAALEVIGELDGVISGLWGLKVIPRIIRDWGYGLVAKTRFMLLGHTSVDQVADDLVKARLVDTWEPDASKGEHVCRS
ncbi:yuxK [Symbiodinium sp. KB8]|nr:yuxK [Symbiodinium sp. KB8]